MKFYWKENKGLSLVELIVTVALVTIVGLAIVSFILTGTNHYKRENSEVNLQNEAQLASGQLESMILNATRGVSYETESATRHNLYLYQQKTQGTDIKQYVTKISWDQTTAELLYSTYLYSAGAGGSGETMTPINTDQLMTEYVTGFTADLSKMQSERLVILQLDLGLNGKTYQTDCKVKLRNDVSSVASASAAFTDTGSTAVTATVSAVTVTPGVMYIPSGGSGAAFSAVVVGNNYPIQDVVWSVSGNTDAATTISSDGKVTLGQNETSSSLTVHALSVESKKSAGGDTSKYAEGTASVKIQSVTSLNLNSVTSTTSLKAQGVFDVYGANLDGGSDVLKKLTVKITDQSGKALTDINTVITAAADASGAVIAPTNSHAAFQVTFLTTNAAYDGVTVKATPYYNGKNYSASAVDVKFVKKQISHTQIVIRKSAESGWPEAATSYTTARGAALSFGLKVTYTLNGTETSEIITPGMSEWDQITWTVYKGNVSGSGSSDFSAAVVSTLLGTSTTLHDLGTFSVSTKATDFNYSLGYAFSLVGVYQPLNTTTSYSAALSLSIPKISITVAEKKGTQASYPLAKGVFQTLNLTVAGIETDLYDITAKKTNNASIDILGSTAIVYDNTEESTTLTFGLLNLAESTAITATDTITLNVKAANVTGMNGLYLYTAASSIVSSPTATTYVYYLLDGRPVTFDNRYTAKTCTLAGKNYALSSGKWN